ncbi:MAG: SEC-C metal-binding domain-containing protein [Rhodocyclaceae bacterium]|nr:SEC-C metal-binding domain-containing protein [Rhodocyclaceae bacterium]
MNLDLASTETAELDALLRLAVQETLATTDFSAALNAFLAALPETAPEFMAMLPAGSERAIAFTLLREVWNHTPRPDHGWKRLPLPKPERNAPCPCGSGRKYKHCCGELDRLGPPLPDGFTVLGYVLETIPVRRFAELPFRQLDPQEVSHVASEWSKEGRLEPAIALLEALLAPGGKFDARHEHAFDELCSLYLDAGRAEERLALVERFLTVPDKPLRGAAWQRRATIHADAGEFDQAWAAFKEAQRLDPDQPALALLELTLLGTEGRLDEAQARAAFWSKRLRKLGEAREELLEFLEEVARNPAELLGRLMSTAAGEAGDFETEDFADDDEASEDESEAFIALLERLPAPQCHYRLTPFEDSAGPLEPTAALVDVEREWGRVFWDGRAEDRGYWADTDWLEWLEKTPLAWQSFAVLEDVSAILDESLFPEAFEERLDVAEERLLDHSVALLRQVIAENGAEGKKLEWGWHENRPALRLLMNAAELAYGTDKELPLLEWLIALNPNDNGGQRERLVHLYCEQGRPADALALCERYPGDELPGTLYGRVLALYLLGRRGEAVAALAQAKKCLPKVLKTLLAARPKPPAMTPGGVIHGGDDEAWLYRLEYRPSWESCGALRWLEEVSGARR